MKRLLFSYLTLWFFVTFGCDPLQSPKELINSGKLQDAAVLLEKIVQAKPENVEARILLGETYDQSGQYNQSVNQFREAILILPAQPKDQAILRIRLAKLYLKNSDRRKAFSQLRLTLQSTSDQDIISQVAGYGSIPNYTTDQGGFRQLLTKFFARWQADCLLLL